MVHGYWIERGEGGVLRARLRGFCEKHIDAVRYGPVEDVESHSGLIVVTEICPLPDARQQLGEAVVHYCAGRSRLGANRATNPEGGRTSGEKCRERARGRGATA